MDFKKLILASLIIIFSSPTYAGAKGDFVNAVKKSCGKTQEEASSMATPGRSGTVMKWKKCTAQSINIKGCELPCKDASSSIGG